MAPPKGSSMPPIPKMDAESKAFFESMVPDRPAVTVRPMFGNVAAFVNGNMFMGLFGPDLFLRLPDADRHTIATLGGGPFEPMPGRAMGEYVVIPAEWRAEHGRVREWVARSLDHAEALPPKEKKPSKEKKPAKKRT